MFRKKQQSNSRLFHVQDDGRFGQVSTASVDDVIDEMFFSGSRTNKRRASMSCTVSLTRMKTVGALMLSVVMLFFARSAQLQIMQGEHYEQLANRNRERTELVVPSRGLILDRWGEPLAWNEPAFLLTMTIADLPEDDDERRALFVHVADLVGLQPTDFDLLMTQYSRRVYDSVPVIDEVSYEAAIRLGIEVADLPGFELTTHTKRVYSSAAPSMSHVLGYTGSLSAVDFEIYADDGYRPIDKIGKTGIEREAEGYLRGVPGRLTYEMNALGERLSIVSKEEAELGSDVTLGIDSDFQKFIEKEMNETFDRIGASRGSVVAIDPQTGAIRAMVSLPTYDANEFIGGISVDRYSALLEDEDQPLFPRAIAGEFPSGSTFKPFMAYAALAEGIVGEHTSFLSTGGVRIGQWFFPDWKDGGHGVTDVRKAISESVNTYFYIIGGGFDNVTGLGVTRISEYASRFGFGSVTGIDLPSEADGFLPSKEWKQEAKGERWYVGDTYHLSIGQGDFLTTPVQMAVATAVVANGGIVRTPHVIESASGFAQELIVDSDSHEIDGLDSALMNIVRQGMRQTVTQGSARSLSVLKKAVAAKTGTAQSVGNRPYHSWFTGFGPYENPDLAIVVLIEEGGGSNDAAVPLAKKIFEWWFANPAN
jgi:penicillin-binding protein 2